ncbi:hypothetical protein ACRQ5Q_24380 [Bradyrhizobium sp. PMVTL-01]|uniref:hypothetical protein n=1 Tax=Bradyrhizobium sp. PMVTL-01 TaxID=3434999 RepID=UPI003F72DA71
MNYPRANYQTDCRDRRPKKRDTLDATERALLAIYAALNCNGLMGWNDWNAYAAKGEWV